MTSSLSTFLQAKVLSQILLASSLLLFPLQSSAQQAWRSDGNWWTSLAPKAKEAHLLGVMDGLLLQESLVLRSHIDIEADRDSLRKRQADSMAASKRMLKNLNSNQISDGLDAFYHDYRNRHISLPNALLIVIYQINAEPPIVIENLIDAYRKVRY